MIDHRHGSKLLRSICSLTALVAALCGSATAQPMSGAPGAESDLRALEQQLADALQARDESRMSSLLAPDYVLRGSPDIDRATWIRNALTLCWGDLSDLDAFRLQIREDVAVASFELTFNTDPVTCRPARLRSLITDVWIRQGGQWQLHIRHAGAPPGAGTGVAAQFGMVPEPPPIWDVSGELSLVATGGNTSTRTVGAGGVALHRTDRTTTRAAVAFLSSKADDVTNAQSVTIEGRHGIRVRRGLDVFGQGAYARDRFVGIQDRVATGAGLAYTTVWGHRQTLLAAGSLGYTAERRLDLTTRRFATGTGGLKYVWTLVPGAEFSETVDVIADLQQAGNWRGTSATAVVASLTGRLSLKASQVIEYRHAPVAGFGRTDMRSTVAFVLSLQRRPGAP